MSTIDPYAEGKWAYMQGKSLSDNPYPSHRAEHAAWEQGFDDEEDGDE